MKSSNLILPLSIVVAGMLIGAFTAGAIVYVNKSGGTQAAQGISEPFVTSLSYKEVTNEDHLRGSVEAPVKLVDYSDLECPFCKRHHETLRNMMSSYDSSEVAWVYRHFPLEQLHAKAIPEAVASECVADIAGEEAFWSFIDRIYEETPSNDGLDLEMLPEYAGELGVDVAAFESCYDSESTLERVEADLVDAQSAGGTGTPYGLLISDKKISKKVRNDIFGSMQEIQAGELLTFSEDGHAVGVSGAIPEETMRLMIDRLLELNS